MSGPFPSAAARRDAARAAVEAMDERRGKHLRLRVRCTENHHVALVYNTPLGLVCVTRTGPRSHGSKDFADSAHHASKHGSSQADLVDPGPEAMADDELPASCECGPRMLSREELLAAVAAGERRILVS